MRFLLIASALLLTAFAHQKDEMIQSNRVVTSIGTSCEECQSVVKRFSEAIKDPKKVQELKMLLNVLCHETSYVDECRLFVSRLEVFLEKLQPYLSDTHAVCAKMRLCSNNRIDAFRRLLLTLAKRVDSQMLTNFEGRVLCDECEFACKEVKAVVEDKATQTEIRDFIRGNICASLGTYRGFCDLIVDEYLPQFIQEVDAILQDPHQVCVDIHACDTSAVTQPRKWVGLLGFIQRL